MKPTPKGWPRVSPSAYYDDANAAIDWLARVFGFDVKVKVQGEDGRIHHSQLTFGEGLVMVGQTGDPKRPHLKSPRSAGGVNTQALMLFVDDVDAHCKRAHEAGAKIVMEPTTNDYGDEYWTDRSYEAEDLEGHHWWFVQRMRG